MFYTLNIQIALQGSGRRGTEMHQLIKNAYKLDISSILDGCPNIKLAKDYGRRKSRIVTFSVTHRDRVIQINSN